MKKQSPYLNAFLTILKILFSNCCVLLHFCSASFNNFVSVPVGLVLKKQWKGVAFSLSLPVQNSARISNAALTSESMSIVSYCMYFSIRLGEPAYTSGRYDE